MKARVVDRTWVINKNHPGLQRMITGISVADESCLFSRCRADRGYRAGPGDSLPTASRDEEKRVVSKGTKNQVSLYWWYKEVMDVYQATLASKGVATSTPQVLHEVHASLSSSLERKVRTLFSSSFEKLKNSGKSSSFEATKRLMIYSIRSIS